MSAWFPTWAEWEVIFAYRSTARKWRRAVREYNAFRRAMGKWRHRMLSVNEIVRRLETSTP